MALSCCLKLFFFWISFIKGEDGKDLTACEHTFGEWIVGEEANCTSMGYEVRTCSLCGKVEYHFTQPFGHDLQVLQVVEASCAEKGYEYDYCTVCGTLVRKEIPETGHTEVIDEAVEATCTQAGKTEGKHCSVCGEVLVAQETIPAKGHTEVIDEAVAATCTQAGKTEGKHCSVCGEVLVAQETIPAKGHNYQDGKCTMCGKNEPKPSVGLAIRLNDDGNSYMVMNIGDCKDTEIIIPSTYNGKPVTRIEDNAFQGCNGLTSIVIPDSVTSIGRFAFV